MLPCPERRSCATIAAFLLIAAADRLRTGPAYDVLLIAAVGIGIGECFHTTALMPLVADMAPAALINLVVSGEIPLSPTIFDANVTHVISAAIMAYFGSGPVRGFAVVLMIGVLTSVFTAVYFTRMLVALWLRRERPRELHI